MEKEFWDTLPRYKGCYDFSNYGRVYSIRQKRILKDVKPNKNDRYIRRTLRDIHNNLNTELVHRIVAEIFIPNPNNYQFINHKDENKSNNYVGNLEWCTREYNNNYGTRNKRASEKLKNHPSSSKPVLQYTLNGEFVAEYPSMREAKRNTRIDDDTISMCCNGKYRHAGGYLWRYKN